MLRENLRIVLGVTCLVSLNAACSATADFETDPDAEASGSDAPAISTEVSQIPTFDEYREAARKTLDGREVFVVERDMLFDSEAELKEYYSLLFNRLEEKSIINTTHVLLIPGGRDVRPNPTNIRYCYVGGWGSTTYTNFLDDWDGNPSTPDTTGSGTAPPLSIVQPGLESAMRAWEAIANVRFTHVDTLDGNGTCVTSNSNPNPNIDFVVTHYASACTAIGPFPSASPSNQRLLVPVCSLSVADWRLLAIHEVGHALGFRHEHIHSGASPQCPENSLTYPYFEELTPFDPDSVMKYSNCTTGNDINATELSMFDGIGARIVYGPPNWWWAVLPPGSF